VTTKYYINEDGKACSIQDVPCDVLIVPQASLAGKIKQKNVQYHSLIEKSEGEIIYSLFVELMKNSIHEKSKFQLILIKQGSLQSGVYGNRQGLKFNSEGPFTHTFEL
jgi:D-aminoacyl-tRNA deacylase